MTEGEDWLERVFHNNRPCPTCGTCGVLGSLEREGKAPSDRATVLEEAAALVEHRLGAIISLAPAAAGAVLTALPDAIRQLASQDEGVGSG